MEQLDFDNNTLGRYITQFEANPTKAQSITRAWIQTDDYGNFKRLKSANCRPQLDGIILDVKQGTVFDDALRTTLEWLLSSMVGKVKLFVLLVYTPTQDLLDFILPLLDNAALDLSESNNALHVFDESYTRIEESVYLRSTKLLDYFPSLAILFHWKWPIPYLNSTNTILLKAALQSRNVKKLQLLELDLEAGDQLGKVIGEEVDQVQLTELVFDRTHLSLGRFPHEIVEKSKNLTRLTIEYHADNQKHILAGRPYISVCETSFDTIRKTLEAASTITHLHLFNITNLKTNDGFKIADCMPNLEYLDIRNTSNKPLDSPSYPNLDLTLTDFASLCGPSLKDVWLQIGSLATLTNQPIDQYIKALLTEVHQNCPNLEALRIQSLQSWKDINYRDDPQSMRRSLVADNHSSTVHDRLIAQADICKFAPAKLQTFGLSFTDDKGEQVISRRIFKWEKEWGYARLVDINDDYKNANNFKRKVVHLPIELEELFGVPDVMVNNWTEIIESLPQAED